MPDNTKLDALLSDAARRGIDYRQAALERSVAPTPEAVAAVEKFIEPMPQTGTADAEVLAMLDDIGTPATVNMVGPRYFGFVIGGSLPVTVATNWLSAAWDQNVGMHEVTPATSTLELVSMAWMKELFGLPENAAAAFVTGATVANFSALAAARNRVYNDVGWNVEADGLIGAPPVTIIISEESHPTVYKSLGLLGFGRNRVVRAPVDAAGRIDIKKFPDVSGPTIVCTQAGNVNTGAFDPVGEICELVKPHGAWVHVDGAFGLWAAASPDRAHLCSGFAAADSWATDAHKWLNVPYDSGVAFVRDVGALKSAMAITAEYLPTETEFRNPSDFTPELSRRARGVDVWAALKSLGRDGVAEMIDRCCSNARRFAERLQAEGFEVLNDVVLNQVLVAFGDEAETQRVIAGIQEDGTCWCGITIWQGRTAMRISVCNWSTTPEDVDRSVEAILRVARQ
ncbi:MAG: aminotransferase class V-fold PLP-dependent enzyme [Pseudomonadota bacterium]